MTSDRLENSTLHVNPGDHLIINLTNDNPATPIVLKIDQPNPRANKLPDLPLTCSSTERIPRLAVIRIK